MWPLDLGRSGDYVRIGAHAAELWRGQRRGLSLVASESLPRRGSIHDAAALAAPLQVLVSGIKSARAAVVIESAFAPVLLADTGGILTNGAQVEALLRHRFRLAYQDADSDSATWTLRSDHRFGERYALGFALPPAVRVTLLEVAHTAKIEFSAWRPALAWGLDRFSPWRRWPQRSGWWVWPEQDRALVAHIGNGRVDGLNAASRLQASVREVESAIAIEAVRSGIDDGGGPIGVAHWRADEGLGNRVGRVRCVGIDWAPEIARDSRARDTQSLATEIE